MQYMMSKGGQRPFRLSRRLLLAAPPAWLLLAACGPRTLTPRPSPTGRGESVASPPLALPRTVALAVSEPTHVTLPGDESPHGDLTEWWYYTGHLAAAGDRHYGFELVFFQSRRGDAPPGYAAHYALTDDQRGTFQFQERAASGEQGGKGSGFDLTLGDWHVQGSEGHDALKAAMDGYAIDVRLASLKPAALEGGSGLLDFGAYGKSYYYSRTRMAVVGTLTDHGEALPVNGLAWMDHQWGNFIVGSVGGWDWYALQLDDGADVMLSVNRGGDGKTYLAYGTYMPPTGTQVDLPASAFGAKPLGTWTSPKTGITYPSGWHVAIPTYDLDLTLQPTVKDQELATTSSTGVTYWEGEVVVSGKRGSQPAAGRGYVELTGYRPAK